MHDFLFFGSHTPIARLTGLETSPISFSHPISVSQSLSDMNNIAVNVFDVFGIIQFFFPRSLSARYIFSLITVELSYVNLSKNYMQIFFFSKTIS